MQPAKNHRILTWLTGLVLFLTLAACAGGPFAGSSEKQKSSEAKSLTQTAQEGSTQAIFAALQESVAGREDVLPFLIFEISVDHIQFSQDGRLALVWIALIDPDTNLVIENEPPLAIAELVGVDPNRTDAWKITVQADADWGKKLKSLPEDVISSEMREHYLPGTQKVAKDHVVFDGYLLPWQAGLGKRVSGSIGHVLTYKTCPATCLYAFDFADGTMFPIMAARSGRVKYAVWQYPNNNKDRANYIVLEDTSTNPTTYQVYYHLAQDSIPPELRVRGAQVYQGQFIGNVDNTGPSTASHLHFMVHTNSGAYWGTSVDITFDDVTVNGGRPRTCGEAAQFPGYGSQCMPGNVYVSRNGDNKSPTGVITSPEKNTVIKKAEVTVKGSATDDTGVKSIQLMISTDGSWRPVGDVMTSSPFKTKINLCKEGVPNGPFLLALRVLDQSGKYSVGTPGQRVLDNQAECTPPPPPICEPNGDQIAIYSQPGFDGPCQVLDYGDYGSPDLFGVVKDNDLESVRVGQNVLLILHDQQKFVGASEILLTSDENLANNEVGANKVSSLRVQPRPPAPGEPVPNRPVNDRGLPPTDLDRLNIRWEPGQGSTEFRAELEGPNGFTRSLDWQEKNSWQVDPLPVGEYTLIVRGRNIIGETKASLNFEVLTSDVASVTRLNPLPAALSTTAVMLQWDVLEGASDLDRFEIQYRKGDGEWKNWDKELPGSLRQAWFTGEAGQLYAFRLRSVDLKGNTEEYPAEAQARVLLLDTGQTDVYEKIIPGDNQWKDAAPIEAGEKQERNFFPQGDEDWITFQAKAGTAYLIRTDPISGAASAAIQLYNMDGETLLGEVKPEDYNQAAELRWTAPEDGVYFVRLSPITSKLSGADVLYTVKVMVTGKILIPAAVGGSLIVSAMWFFIKFYYRLRKKNSPGIDEFDTLA